MTDHESQGQALRDLSRARTDGTDDDVLRAERAVVLAHLIVASTVARTFHRPHLCPEDLEQIARLSLVVVTRGWDPGKDPEFRALAVDSMTGSPRQHLRENQHLIPPPRRLQEINAAADRLVEELRVIGYEPAAPELARRLRLSVHELDEARTARRAVADLDGIGDLAGDGFEDDQDRTIDLRRALSTLSEHDRSLVVLYFWLEWSQSRIAGRLGISRMQVSRLLVSVIRALRRRLAD